MAHTTGHTDSTVPRAERRQLIVMMCDLVGSTALSGQFDPEELRDLLTTFRQTCNSEINRFGGFVARYIGDGIIAYFGYPQAQEHEVEHSVRAGLEIVRSLAELSGPRLEVRIGIATGTVVVGDIVGEGTEERDAVVGQTPNLAARLMTVAEPGEVIISESTRDLLHDLFEFRDLGTKDLKGFSKPVRAWQIVGESAVRSRSHAIQNRRHLTPLIARDDDVQRLERCWEEAATGKGQIVLVSGEAGIGKSRLVGHFEQKIKARKERFSSRKLFCSDNYQNSTLHPLTDDILKNSEVNRNDSDGAKAEKIASHLNRHARCSKDDVDLVLDLLSINHEGQEASQALSPDVRKTRTFHVLEQYICERAHERPELLIVEDLHWSDATTMELLERIVLKRAHNLPMLIVLTFRTDFSPAWPDEHYLTNITLRRLSPADSEKLLHEMASDLQLTSDVTKEIIERSDRIPLFLEEIFKVTQENITLSKNNNESQRAWSSSETGVPMSLAGSLMERLDRLGPVKNVAQVAAAIGHVFSSELLEDVVLLGRDELHGALDQLVAAEIVRRRDSGAELGYVFKHALLRDAAYSSLLRGERKELHRRIAGILEEKHSETARREPELLAHHCSNGGLAEPAIDYWQKAGERARERSANSEAVGHLHSGLDLLKTLPNEQSNREREIDLRTSLALALTALHGGGAAEVKENYWRARELSQLDRDSSKHFTILIGSWLNSFIGGDLYNAQSLSYELLELAERKDDVAYLVEAKRVRGMTLFYVGDFVGARSTIESAIELHDPQHHRLHALRYGLDPLVCCQGYLAHVYLFLGHRAEAISKSDEAVVAAQALNHPYTHAFSIAFAAFVRQNLEMTEAARDLAKKAIQVADDNEFEFWAKQQTVVQCWADLQLGETKAGTLEMRKALDAYLESGSIIGRTRILSLMAEVYINHGQTTEAMAMLERALRTVSRSGETFYLAEIHRLEAELCFVHQGKQATSEVCSNLSRSLDVSESQKAVLWQIRTARSIGRLAERLRLHPEASERLLGLCDGSDESNDTTATTRAARRLLEMLTPAQDGSP